MDSRTGMEALADSHCACSVKRVAARRRELQSRAEAVHIAPPHRAPSELLTGSVPWRPPRHPMRLRVGVLRRSKQRRGHAGGQVCCKAQVRQLYDKGVVAPAGALLGCAPRLLDEDVGGFDVEVEVARAAVHRVQRAAQHEAQRGDVPRRQAGVLGGVLGAPHELR